MCWARRPVRAEPEVPAPLGELVVSISERLGPLVWREGTRLCSRIHCCWRRGLCTASSKGMVRNVVDRHKVFSRDDRDVKFRSTATRMLE
jgi:hypothetical protein